jgi:hypothetical protein
MNTTRGLFWAGLGAITAALVVLAVGADTTPTTLDTRRLFGLWRLRHVLAALALLTVGIVCLARARSHDTFRSVVTAVVTVCVSVGLLEGLGRAGWIPWQRIFAPSFGDLGPLGTQPAPDQDVKGVSRKDTASVWGIPSEAIPFHYRTDRRGFRNHPGRETASLYLIGDSVLVGALVPFEQTLVARLEALLGEPVIQAALINTAPQTMIEHFGRSGLDVGGRLVVQFVFEGNDLGDSAALQPGRAASVAASIESKSLLDHAWRLVTAVTEPTLGIARTRSCMIGGLRYTFFWTAEHVLPHADQAEVITRALENFAERLRGQGARYAVVVVPTKLRILGPLCPRWPDGSDLADWRSHLSPLRDHVLSWGSRSGIPVLDLTPALEAAARRGVVPWFDTDTHWNAQGHEVAARALADWVATLRAR